MKDIAATLRGAKRIALVSHRDPDPDTVGSALALGLGLESLGKRVSWHCADEMSARHANDASNKPARKVSPAFLHAVSVSF